jgi:hypothetical protein
MVKRAFFWEKKRRDERQKMRQVTNDYREQGEGSEAD